MADNLNENTTVEESTEETLTMTKSELDALLQREGDRRVSSALKKQEVKLKEAEKVARMNDAERYEYELKQREAAIEAKEKELNLAQNKAACSKILAEKGLSQDFVDFVVTELADDMDANIKKIERAFKASVKAEVEKRIGTSAPKVATTDPSSLSKESFRKLSLAEKQKLYNEDRELYNSLNN